VLDLAGDAVMGDPANLTDPTWYDEFRIHPTDAGSARISTNQVTPVMNTILATI
jgi:hypothetical protein